MWRPYLRFLVACAFGVVLLVLLVPGCGRTSLEPEFFDGGSSSSTCGPETCPDGCCDASGICRAGNDPRACGSVGGRCSDCLTSGFAFCTARGVCGRNERACGTATCTGCCSVESGILRCLSGSQPSACGRGGEACSTCSDDGRSCNAATGDCSTTRCDAANCDGCCVGDQCLPGSSASACGAGGAACTTCASGQSCRAQTNGGGACAGTPTCGPDNCDGCCDAAGRCVVGGDTTACGRNGARCAACTAGQICVATGQANAHTCQALPACGPTNCSGCCSNGVCIDSPTAQACGANGVQCRPCGFNQVCSDAGACVADSCANTCKGGCCVGESCIVGTQPTACGIGGAQCQNCTTMSPARTCENNACVIPPCGPSNCRNGCCRNNVCEPGTANAACGPTGGGACEDCSANGERCLNRSCAPLACGPRTCPDGCCRNGLCESGTSNAACGQGGGACVSCEASRSFCNGLVTPRRCNNLQNSCPAAYGACNAGALPPIAQAQNRCTQANLATLAAACSAGPESQACINAVAALPTNCRTCMTPFNVPYNENAGLYACAASFVGAQCRQAMGCAADCAQDSCRGCATTSEDSCFALVNSLNGQCRNFFGAALLCTNNALAAGQPCSQFTYPHFGEWFRNVGDRFCGNGP